MARAEDGFFDDLARGLADGSLTRGKALRLIGAAVVGGSLGSLGIGEAGADNLCKPNGKKCNSDNQCCSGTCSSGTCQAQTTTTTTTPTTTTSTTTPTTSTSTSTTSTTPTPHIGYRWTCLCRDQTTQSGCSGFPCDVDSLTWQVYACTAVCGGGNFTSGVASCTVDDMC